MDIARCTENDRTYTAANFADLPAMDLGRMRRYLLCSECDGPAFFRKATKNGRAACFGARPHEDGCVLAAQDSEQVVEGEETDLDALRNPGDRIIVDLQYGAHLPEVHGDSAEGRNRAGRAPRHVGGLARPDARMHRRLSSLLRTLIEVPSFRSSNQTLEVADYQPMLVREFFVQLHAVNTDMKGQFRGWWGSISDAQEDEGNALWLNSGGRGDISFCIPSEVRAQVLDRFNLEDTERLAGAYILVIADLRVSSNNKKYCIIDAPGQIAIRLT
ncbi:hypothetical protein [Achromobacter aegrifaciens]